jgi:hypothetical protein
MPRPALFTHASTRPKRASAAAITRSTSTRRVTSAVTGSASPARRATASSASRRRAASTSRAPRRASSSASAAPIPALAPVTTTTLSS